MPYLIFLDLDSTLLPESKIIPKKTVRYLNYLADSGNIIVLCTGRPYTGSLKYYEALDGKCYLSCDNGTRIVKPADSLFEMIVAKFDPTELNAFFDEVNEDIALALCIGLKDIYGKNLDLAPFWMKHELTSTKYFDNPHFYKLINEPISLINLYVFEQQNEHFLKTLEKYPNLTVFDWGLINEHHCYEMTNMGANKGYTVKILQNLLNISPNMSIAFGDNLNDLSMFENVSYSVAMKNANDFIKSKAKYQTKRTSEKEGVRKFLKSFFKTESKSK